MHLLSALSNVYPDIKPKGEKPPFGMAVNEALSFQTAVRLQNESGTPDAAKLRVDIQSPLADRITVYTVENVPVLHNTVCRTDDWVERRGVGLYPDRLALCEDGLLTLPKDCYRSVFFTVNRECETLEAGKYPVTIRLLYGENSDFRVVEDKTDIAAEVSFELNVLPFALPEQRIKNTNWFHYDCIAQLSYTEPFSDENFEVIEKYLRLAAENGQNMVLVPAFTPPLDTPIGGERQTVQLVGVEKCDGNYLFDFSAFDRFLHLALDCGIRYFEHSHLYTQSDAAHAPKIEVRENGKTVKMFGWETDAAGAEYRGFLTAYLKALKEYLKINHMEERFFFHVTDEPRLCWMDAYEDAAHFIYKQLEGFQIGDALFDYEFYEKGLVQTPIVNLDHIEKFLGRAEPIWLYYTGAHCYDYFPNRIIGMPQARGRILGVQLYYYRLQGFLHWGFNAHHNNLSRRIIDPSVSPEMGGDFCAGSSYIAYPYGRDAQPSTRLITFRDAMQDVRALQLLENRIGRETAVEVIKKHIPDIGFHSRVTDAQLLELFEEVYALICSNER